MESIEALIGVVGIGGIALIAAILLFIVARKAMKLVIRVVIFGVIVIALLIGGTAFWFTRSGSGSQNKQPANTRRK